jgi:hypothetical protein
VTDFSPLDTFRETAGRPDPGRSDRIRHEFRARIATMAPDDEGRRPFDPAVARRARSWRRPGQPVLAIAALALVLVLAGAAALVLPSSPRSDSLDDLASAAANRSDAGLRDEEYLHLSERTTAHGTSIKHDQWTAPNGTGQAMTTPLSLGPSSSDLLGVTRYGKPGSLDFAGMTYDELRTLPAEPGALLDRLDELDVATSRRPGAQAIALGRVLALQVTPPEVGAAAIRAFGRLGGTTIGAVPDAAGRVGAGVRGANGDGTTWLVVLDPSSGVAMAAHEKVDPTTPAAAAPGRVWISQNVTTSLPSR